MAKKSKIKASLVRVREQIIKILPERGRVLAQEAVIPAGGTGGTKG